MSCIPKKWHEFGILTTYSCYNSRVVFVLPEMFSFSIKTLQHTQIAEKSEI